MKTTSTKADWLNSAVKTAAATALFALFHSAVASLGSQSIMARRLGVRQRRGAYRSFYIVQSFLSLGALGLYLRRLPDRRLYRAGGRLAGLLRAGQLAGLLFAEAAAWRVGLLRITGLASFFSWLKGADMPVIEPAAQGPAPGDSGRLKTGWPFTWTRHPLNFAPLPVFWLNPVMTVKLLAFTLVASLYLVIGSWHEERRLLARYGEAYRRYQHSGVPFFLPRPK